MFVSKRKYRAATTHTLQRKARAGIVNETAMHVTVIVIIFVAPHANKTALLTSHKDSFGIPQVVPSHPPIDVDALPLISFIRKGCGIKQLQATVLPINFGLEFINNA